MVLWHYTYSDAVISILKDGFIKPATDFIEPGERPIVWFSKEQFWEPTVTKGGVESGQLLDLTMDDMVKRGYGLFRIGVNADTAPYTWSELKLMSGMGADLAAGLVRSAKRRGANPSRWRGTLVPLPRADWVRIEEFRRKEWIPIDIGETRWLQQSGDRMGESRC